MQPASTNEYVRADLDSYLGSRLVKIEVSQKRLTHIYYVREAALCHYSALFRDMLKWDMQEKSTRHFFLKEDPELFHHCIGFFNSGRLPEGKGRKPWSPIPQERTDVPLTQHTLARLWIVGHYYRIPALQNQALNQLHRNAAQSWNDEPGLVDLVYKNTFPDAKLRAYLVEAEVDTSCVDVSPTDPPEWLADVVNRRKAILWLDEEDATPEDPREQLADRANYLITLSPCMNYGVDEFNWLKKDLCSWHEHTKRDCYGNVVEPIEEPEWPQTGHYPEIEHAGW